ncbi:MAG: hypothetical protein U5K77_03825 [Candidatus Saccharibacteria bacterium]|nr:hypothetical protein [Candidatus Saccharibacteria bacterium]
MSAELPLYKATLRFFSTFAKYHTTVTAQKVRASRSASGVTPYPVLTQAS